MEVRCATGHMGPALQEPLQYCGRTGASAPTVLRNEEERRGGALPLPRAGKSAKRRRWRMQRAGFEEVPRLADTTVAGNRLARRWAREPRPYGSVYKECDAVRNPPVTASPCQPPLGKGAMGTGVRIATASVRTGLAMTLVFHGGAVCGGAYGPRPTRVFAILRADRGVRPYGSATRGAMGGRPQGSPLRKRYKKCGGAGRCRHRPLRGEFGENKRKKQEDTGVPSCF